MYKIVIVYVAVIRRRWHTPWWINKDKSKREKGAEEEEDEVELPCVSRHSKIWAAPNKWSTRSDAEQWWCRSTECKDVKWREGRSESVWVCVSAEEKLLPLGAGVSGKRSFWALSLDGGEQVVENQQQKEKVTLPLKKGGGEERGERTCCLIILRSGEKWRSRFQGCVVMENRGGIHRAVHPPSGAHTPRVKNVHTCRQKGHPAQMHKTRRHSEDTQKRAFILYTPNCAQGHKHTCKNTLDKKSEKKVWQLCLCQFS